MRRLHAYQLKPCVFSHRHHPFVYSWLCFHPEMKKKKFSQKRWEKLHTQKKENLKQVYSIPTLRTDKFSPSVFLSPSPPGCVHPNLGGGQCCSISKGLSSSAQLCGLCTLDPLRCSRANASPSAFICASHTAGVRTNRRKTCSQWYNRLKTSERRQWISVAFVSTYIGGAVFVCTSDDKFHSTN